jgi:hypothetical protein
MFRVIHVIRFHVIYFTYLGPLFSFIIEKLSASDFNTVGIIASNALIAFKTRKEGLKVDSNAFFFKYYFRNGV